MRITEFAAAAGSRVEGLTEDFEILGITSLDEAQASEVSFVSGDKFLERAMESHASALIVPKNMRIEGRVTIPLSEPWTGVLLLLNHFCPPDAFVFYKGRHASAVIDPTARIEAGVTIAPHVYIGAGAQIGKHSIIGPGCIIGSQCVIGEDCMLDAAVVLAPRTILCNRVIIHPGAVLGADGFKFEVIGGKWTKIPQAGRVIIEDDVEIGANVCIDRASFTETRIGANTKIDNLVQIAHNVRVGADCIIVSQSGIAGSSEIGDGSIVAAQTGIADNLKLGRNVRVMAQSGVKDNIADGEVIAGAPARPFRRAARILAAQAKLPELTREVARLRERIEQLEKLQSQKP
ncbi:MAG: UDP-3-O-(3-hydroxymyristoyl)glucosamine N-acyltransferase [bacterium]|nr:UDP-3-O-(3-hydroxymyristoyl)glucosamine N-acyltransferase [Candidatus Sumerlaeota bacterium]